MAILGKIRQRSFVLIVVIALALFSFVLADVIQSGGFSQSSRNVGSVNGTDITYEEFNFEVSNVEKSNQNTTAIQAVKQVWDRRVNLTLLNEELEKLGIRISESHLTDVLKSDQNIGGNPMFTNELGQFDINKYKEYKRASSNQEELMYLENYEINANTTAKYQIYANLIRAGYFSTVNDAKFKYNIEKDKVSFDFVSVPYSTINDSEVTVSDNEIIDYMKKNEKKYKSEETREIEYVVILDEPSESDKIDIQERLNNLLSSKVVYNSQTNTNDTLPGFRTTNDVIDFVNSNSDFPYDSTYVAKTDLPAEFAEPLYNLNEGEVFGPYEFNGYYAISRSMGKKAGAKAKASHILISYEGTPVQAKEIRSKEQAQAKAEEILSKVRANQDQFTLLAHTESEDTGSAQRGGDLGFFGPGQMVQSFNDFVFDNPIGRIGMVESEFGFHVIRIDDKQDAIRLATIAQKIEASEKTSDEAYNKALKIELAANNKPLADVANEYKLTVAPSITVAPLDEALGELGNQRAIVKWAYNKDTDIDEVKRFEIPNVGHVVAKLKKVNKEGLLPIESARLQLETTLKNKKKAALISEKMKGATLDEIAKANNVTVQTAEGVALESPVVPGAGFEPKVVGSAFSSEVGKLSPVIEGNSGVYVVSLKEVSKALPATEYATQINALNAQNGAVINRVFPALKDKAKIKDNRIKFEY